MAPKKDKKAMPAVKPPDPLMPVEVPEVNLIAIPTHDRRLIVSKSKVPGTEAYHASLQYPNGDKENCIALRKRPSEAQELMKILVMCSHKNIAKPIGIWKVIESSVAFIVFPGIEGAVSSIDRKSMFEMASELDPNSSVSCFTDQGCRVLVDIVMAVKHVNDLYEKELPLKQLKLETTSIFYQLKAEEDYHVLLADFVTGTQGSGRNKQKGKEVSISAEEVKTANWHGLKKFLNDLCVNLTPNSEMSHFVALLGAEVLRYDDLLWAPAMWDFNTKVQFLREVYWYYDRNRSKIPLLRRRPNLGLQSCIDKLEVNKPRNQDKQIVDRNLHDSMFFLRVFLVAHQDDTIKGYNGPVDINDKRAMGRLVMKERPDYLVKLIQEILVMEWIKESPFLRRHNEYMKEFT